MKRVVVIGAGMGGLASAIRLAVAGARVTLLEMSGTPGGKMRAVDSAAGPVDAGPTVLTMRHQFDALFALAGQRLEDHVGVFPEPILARHWWLDGKTLDLFDNTEASIEAIRDAFGTTEADAFRAFDRDARKLFGVFEHPMMETPAPTLPGMAGVVMRRPSVLTAMAPHLSLASALKRRFSSPHLRQLFGRYATYVGGTPRGAPAILQLIWQAEASGVWRVEGGMHNLARALADLASSLGVRIHYDAKVTRIERQNGRAQAAHTADGQKHTGEAILFNGDPRALEIGLLGDGVSHAVDPSGTTPRSLSARVWSFAATPAGADLIHHNVFFGKDPDEEFGPIKSGQPPTDPTLYICAQDRGAHMPPPDGLERFEIIENAAPTDRMEEKEKNACRTRVFDRLAHYGLTFTPRPLETALTTPSEFNALFPGSLGSLYGLSPEGMTAAFKRPTARSKIAGLYLAGGGTHPGAGIAMAALSGKHAAAAIGTDLALRSTSRPMATRGGMSTASAIAGASPSRSLPS